MNMLSETTIEALMHLAGTARVREDYGEAIEYFKRVITLEGEHGEAWFGIGACYLLQDNLQEAYAAFQQALYWLPNPMDHPKLWYGIGILYDRYGSLDYAEEVFARVMRMDRDKAGECLFRLGIIYKQQGKYSASLDCFEWLLPSPPSPLAQPDIWFQIAHVYEQQRDYIHAKEAYERVVARKVHHAKALQQLGWLYQQPDAPFQNQEFAIWYLIKSTEAGKFGVMLYPGDAQSWYLLGRAYIQGQKYNKAYEAYRQAVSCDGRNPTFWCSIGVLYFQVNQYRDAFDAYSRAIRINPYISEVWFDLGSLYESCNNQISDAINAYACASELDPRNKVVSHRLQLLKNAQVTASSDPAAPGPQDVHPTAYAQPYAGAPPIARLVVPDQRPISTPTTGMGTVEGGLTLPGNAGEVLPPLPSPFRDGLPPVVLAAGGGSLYPPLPPMDVVERE